MNKYIPKKNPKNYKSYIITKEKGFVYIYKDTLVLENKVKENEIDNLKIIANQVIISRWKGKLPHIEICEHVTNYTSIPGYMIVDNCPLVESLDIKIRGEVSIVVKKSSFYHIRKDLLHMIKKDSIYRIIEPNPLESL